MDFEARATQLLAIHLAGRLLVERDAQALRPLESHGTRDGVTPEARKAEQEQQVRNPRMADVVAHVELAIVWRGVRADAEAPAIRGTILHGKDECL